MKIRKHYRECCSDRVEKRIRLPQWLWVPKLYEVCMVGSMVAPCFPCFSKLCSAVSGEGSIRVGIDLLFTKQKVSLPGFSWSTPDSPDGWPDCHVASSKPQPDQLSPTRPPACSAASTRDLGSTYSVSRCLCPPQS